MGLFTLTFAGGSFLLIGAWESLISTSSSSSPTLTTVAPPQLSSSSSPSPPPNKFNPKTPSPSSPDPSFSTVTLISTASLSLLFFLNSLLSFLDAHHTKDTIGTALQLQTLAASSLFFFFSLLGLFTNLSTSLSFPYPLTGLIALFAFIEEFLVFYLQIKDPNGVENRYYDLMLIPIAVCVFSTLIELKSPKTSVPRLARGIGLILQGTWFVQIGFSFFTEFMPDNCSLRERSRGNYTIVCKGHMDSHRGMAIAVLLFNCHLAFVVALIVAVYGIVGRRLVGRGDYTRYRPLGAEMQQMDSQGQFTLEYDDEEEDEDGIREGGEEENRRLPVEVNGGGSNH